MNGKRLRFLIDIAYYGVLILGVYLSLTYLLPVALPFTAALLISAALRRPTDTLHRRFDRLPRKWMAFLVLLAFYVFLGLAFTLVFRALITQLLEFLQTLPSTLTDLAESLIASRDRWIERLPAWLRSMFGSGSTGQLMMSAVDALSAPLMELLGTAGSAAIRLPAVVFVLIITVISSFFITMDYDGIRRTLAALCPKRTRTFIRLVRERTVQAVFHLLKTYGILMLITFGELCVGFWLLNLLGAQISYVVPLSLVISLVDILPVLGVGTVLIPWSAAALFSGDSKLCIMLLALCAVMYVVRNILESRLVGHRFGLHPALTLLALYAGGKWFGLAGIFLFPLLLIVLIQLYRDGVLKRHVY